MNISDKTWLAAAIDGEGSLCLNKKTRRVQLVVYNTSADFAQKAHRLIPYSGIVVLHYAAKKPPLQRRIYSVNLADKLSVLFALLQVYPYLLVKKDKAKEIIEFIVHQFDLEQLSKDTLNWISKYRRFS